MSNGGNERRAASGSSHFLAGLSSGILSAILLQPADLLKTRVQQSQSTTLLATIRNIAAGPSPIRSFWRGTLPSTLRTGFGSALYFSTLNALRTHLSTVAGASGAPPNANSKRTNSTSSSALVKTSNTTNLLAGALARTWAGLLMMPITVLKVRYESSLYNSTYTSLPRAALLLLRTEGLRGFFAGFGATAVRDAPYAGLYVLFYEQSKRRLSALASGAERAVGEPRGPGGGDAGAGAVFGAPAINFASAIFASVIATTFTNPFDAIKTRIQLYPARYANMVVAARRMVGEEGVRSLMDGLGLRMARKGVSSALAWTVYEEIIRRAERRWVDGVEGGLYR